MFERVLVFWPRIRFHIHHAPLQRNTHETRVAAKKRLGQPQQLQHQRIWISEFQGTSRNPPHHSCRCYISTSAGLNSRIPRPPSPPISKVQVAGQAMIAAAFQGGSIQVAERHQVHMRHLRLASCRGWQVTTWVSGQMRNPWGGYHVIAVWNVRMEFNRPSPARFLLDVSSIETVATSSNNKSGFNPKWLGQALTKVCLKLINSIPCGWTFPQKLQTREIAQKLKWVRARSVGIGKRRKPLTYLKKPRFWAQPTKECVFGRYTTSFQVSHRNSSTQAQPTSTNPNQWVRNTHTKMCLYQVYPQPAPLNCWFNHIIYMYIIIYNYI